MSLGPQGSDVAPLTCLPACPLCHPPYCSCLLWARRWAPSARASRRRRSTRCRSRHTMKWRGRRLGQRSSAPSAGKRRQGQGGGCLLPTQLPCSCCWSFWERPGRGMLAPCLILRLPGVPPRRAVVLGPGSHRLPPPTLTRRVEYEPEDNVKVLPVCRHYYHPDCIAEWLKRNKVRGAGGQAAGRRRWPSSFRRHRWRRRQLPLG